MRIARLDLTKYGKFTNQTVKLPQNAKDFHFIVGANEAGKSTIRSAILDLLFGIEIRSKFDFLHPSTEMELGAEIDGTPGKLEFRRVKKRQSSILTPAGGALTDSALSPYLGAADRAFFDQMFGLNHERLVSGGKQILDAGSDIGQLLFESAAGIANFGKVREELEAEANSLWAKTKSANRVYYMAANDYADAEAALKKVLVRTKGWSSAQATVKKLGDEFDNNKGEVKLLESRRTCLERVRRVGPNIRVLQEKNKELSELGEVIPLPENASGSLQAYDIALAKTGVEKSLAESQLEAKQEALDTIQVDSLILDNKNDIEGLVALRQRAKSHATGIEKAEAEVRDHWARCLLHVKELSWSPGDENAIRERLPSSPIMSAIEELIEQAPLVRRNVDASADDLKTKSDELVLIEAQITNLSATAISPPMQRALNEALKLGDQVKEERNRTALLEKRTRELADAKRGLGDWQINTDTLRQLVLPDASDIEALVFKIKGIEAKKAGEAVSLKAVEKAILEQEQEIKNFKDQHHLVTGEEMEALRKQRDELWMAIKSGQRTLSNEANAYETKVTQADAAADARNAKAEALGTLLGKVKNVERVRQDKSDLITSIAANGAELKTILDSWNEKMNSIGLGGMTPEKMASWRDAQRGVIHAEDNLQDAKISAEQFTEDIKSVRTAIKKAMVATPEALDESAPLATWIDTLKTTIDEATRSEARREQLLKARDAAIQSKAVSERKATATKETDLKWRENWGKYLARASLPNDVLPAFAKGALKLFKDIENSLDSIQTIRLERIQVMQSELDEVSKSAARIAGVVAKELVGLPVFDIADKLNARLAQALKEKAEKGGLESEIGKLKTALEAAKTKHDVAIRSISPLTAQAKVETRDELAAAIERSDAHRKLSGEAAAAKKAVLEGGGGLDFDALLAEFSATDIAAIDSDLHQISENRDLLQHAQDSNLTALTTAKSELEKITGQDEAAQAEASRQDAITRMVDAANRYIKVHTAAKLLGWAIDQYREKKQGPMLAKASTIFRMLTLGSFSKLIVDPDSKTQMLAGQRPNNEKVSIDGMSEGARDQLYLALRLAAIELHFDNVAPLPFIADDLFINFDDDRAEAGLQALAQLSEKTQVIFLSHHDHLASVVQKVFGPTVNTVSL